METKEISILDVLKTMLHKWWIILLTAVIFAVGSFVYTETFITPTYSARVTFLVNNSR